jgi:hypothetical protein
VIESPTLTLQSSHKRCQPSSFGIVAVVGHVEVAEEGTVLSLGWFVVSHGGGGGC